MHKAFPASAESVGEARHLVSAHLEHRGCCLESIEQATLLTSEVASNAVLHATTGGFTLDVDVSGDTVHVRVGDDDSRPPTRRRCGVGDESGRGLLLLDKLADRWGVRIQLKGKAVWFELPCSLPRPRSGGPEAVAM